MKTYNQIKKELKSYGYKEHDAFRDEYDNEVWRFETKIGKVCLTLDLRQNSSHWYAELFYYYNLYPEGSGYRPFVKFCIEGIREDYFEKIPELEGKIIKSL